MVAWQMVEHPFEPLSKGMASSFPDVRQECHRQMERAALYQEVVVQRMLALMLISAHLGCEMEEHLKEAKQYNI